MIKNYLTTEKQIQKNSHQGVGSVNLYEVWNNKDFQGNIDFIDRVVVPPNSTIGFHKHGKNEEMYIILEGNGLMRVEDDEILIEKGDMILNPIGGSHGFINNSAKDVDILVIQVSVKKQA